LSVDVRYPGNHSPTSPPIQAWRSPSQAGFL
jgi:hypothetical protein